MSMREKDQADFDLETFVDLFDTAISSDNPTVQRALKNLILISAMVNAQQDPDGLRKGPLRRIVDDINNITKRLNNLESAGAYRSTYAPTTGSPGTKTVPNTWPQPYYPGTPTTGTPIAPGTTQWPTTMPGTIPPGTIISSQSAGDTFSATALNKLDVKVGNLLDKLETK